MATYKGDLAEHVRASLESVCIQSLKPNEVVLVKDGPVQPLVDEIIQQYSTQLPLKIVKLEKNVGLAAALNTGLMQCSNDLVARMDSDDVALPNRFAAQVQFMHEHLDIDVCSAWMEEREDMSVAGRIKRLPASDRELRRFAKLRSPINHPCAIFRRSKVIKAGLYPLLYPEDYALWSVMMQNGAKFANICEVLQYMRVGSNFLKRRGMTMLKGEMQLIHFQKEIGFLTAGEAVRNYAFRVAIRVLPLPARKFLYRISRG